MLQLSQTNTTIPDDKNMCKFTKTNACTITKIPNLLMLNWVILLPLWKFFVTSGCLSIAVKKGCDFANI